MRTGKTNRSILSITQLALCVLLTVGVRTFLRACVHEDGSFGACHGAETAVFAAGAVLSLLSCAAILFDGSGIRLAVLAAAMAAALLAALLPGRIMPLCMMESMRCNSVMKPAVWLLAAAVFVLAAVQMLIQIRQNRKDRVPQ